MLTVLDSLPAGLLNTPAHQLHEVLPGPTLIHLPGRREQPLFVSVLLHGNETTGWLALQELLAKYQDRPLPRALSFLIGNIAAAREQRRHLEQQPDYNRVWADGPTPEHQMMRQVVTEMAQRGIFASVDIHNNTGLNPHYACVNRLEDAFLHLATQFSRTVVYFTRPDNVQSIAFARLGPAVVLECGKPGHPYGVQHALEFLEGCLNRLHLPNRPVPVHDLDLFHTVAVVKVPPGVAFAFGDRAKDLCFPPDLDHFNFHEIPACTRLGWVRPESMAYLEAWDELGQDVRQKFFKINGDEIWTTVPVMPSMLTLDPQVVRQDCLCYLMERMSWPTH
ncbi:M14 family metallopeptidase [Candidatus Cyanaurora vandensis]|uniref:M14 family metallopeptidase n=1 Tax=Candidatus Cyanaurora vandensis TaxID=2714958 RepID=UPI00257E0DE9|nr:M14 family metallopeptidase [Candidatus Cyanaurora vandensis]